jgi:hypothetical protein
MAIMALAIFVLGTVTGLSLPRLATSAAQQTIVVQAPAMTTPRPAIAGPQADSTACGAGTYVSGDMVGDANPATVYATMCGSR